MPTLEEEFRAKMPPNAVKGAGAFEAKMTFVQRCEVLALDLMGGKRSQIAAAYNIARPTVAYICNPASRNYKNVRKELHDLGKERFVRQYLTDEVMEKFAAHVNSIQAVSNDEDYKAERRAQAEGNGMNKNARGEAGPLSLWDPILKVNHTAEIVWCEETQDWGVMLRLSHMEQAERFTIPVDNDTGSFPTSQAAKREFLAATGFEINEG